MENHDIETQKLTPQQSAINGLYTNTACGRAKDVQELTAASVSQQVLAHEFWDIAILKELKTRVEPYFFAICAD